MERTKCMDTTGKMGWDELGDYDCHVYTIDTDIDTIYKIGN